MQLWIDVEESLTRCSWNSILGCPLITWGDKNRIGWSTKHSQSHNGWGISIICYYMTHNYNTFSEFKLIKHRYLGDFNVNLRQTIYSQSKLNYLTFFNSPIQYILSHYQTLIFFKEGGNPHFDLLFPSLWV